MNFTSLLFVPFVLLVCLLYFTLFRKAQWILLLLASLAFYLFSGPKYIVFVIVTTITTYFCARVIDGFNRQEKEVISNFDGSKERKKRIKKKFARRKRLFLILDLLINIGILVVIKYLDFALTGVSSMLADWGIDWSRTFKFVLPLGISFYTFMSIGYLLDVYWKRYKSEKNILRLLLFNIYFPHILQGPISRYNKLAPQFLVKHKFDYDRVCKGFQLMLWGFFEKMVIADRLAIFANGVYAQWETASGLSLIFAIIFFSMQLYLDFQGCMDIGRGVSQVFGIELELNFWHPYFSKKMPEFWRRWHITLGAWFKDYLLYPVSMSKLSKAINRWTRKRFGNSVSRACSTILPAACVWLITGTWHGAAVCYILWGIYHGILIICGAVFEKPIEKLTAVLHINTGAWSFTLFQMVRTFILSAIGRIFFVAAGGFDDAIAIIKRTFDLRNLGLHGMWNDSLYSYGLDRHGFTLSILLIALIWIVSMLQEKFNKDQLTVRDVISKQNIVFRWILYFSLIFAIMIFGIYGSGYDAGAFVYGKF